MHQKKIIITVILLSLVSFFLVYSIENEMFQALVCPIALSIFAAVSLTSSDNLQKPHSNSIMVNETRNTHTLDTNNEVATLYVGNIPYKASEKQIIEHFETVANVHSIRLMKDKRTGKRKGFGFIEVPPRSATDVIKSMNESIFMERNLIVRPAKDKIE